MKFFLGLFCAALVAVIGSTYDANAQYTVCNNSPAVVQVCVWENCGGVVNTIPPCAVVLGPGQCFTWPTIPWCFVSDVDVNGVTYPVQPPGGCLPIAPPNPPNIICFGLPGIDAEIR